ncbi:hypothetical protein VAR608DRAFT_4980 [Variovorax sp. HW608]|nr:hypothetical protein [Variovorax sp. HW608]SCK49853.1 hypothetical protein VAR608DRAFT_4980 [Variovorax sp. HW608]
MVASVPARLEAPSAGAASFAAHDARLPSDVSIRLATGYSRSLPAGSQWRPIGQLLQGQVYRPLDSVFTIEGRQVHEAYLVVRADVLTGFYLPAEGRFSPLDPPVQLPKGVFQ